MSLDFPDQEFCIPDIDFGYVLYEPETDDDFSFNKVAKNYTAVLYFIDHVNGLAYPLYSYSRRNLSELTKTYGVKDVKESFKAVLTVSRDIMDYARKNAVFFFPETLTPWEEREKVSKAHYDHRVAHFLSRVLTCASDHVDELSEARANFLWNASVFNPSYAENIQNYKQLAIFLNGEQKAHYQQEAQKQRASKAPKTPKL